jgi:gluconate 2-dehydrogenase gamma chain
MQTPYANGAIWYMQGPYLDAKPQFGYQGRQTLKEIIRTGIAAFDAHCKAGFAGKSFKDLPHGQQEALLRDAESGKLELKDASSRLFFRNLLAEVRNGYFCDPVHGGNKGMAAWKMIGYPGMRGDYLDWVEVRDKAYPLPAVDLAGTRG